MSNHGTEQRLIGIEADGQSVNWTKGGGSLEQIMTTISAHGAFPVGGCGSVLGDKKYLKYFWGGAKIK